MSRQKSELFFRDFKIVNSNQPVYYQLYNSIKNAILSGRLRSGYKLPPTRAIAEATGISRTTVLKSFDMLIAEGYIAGKAGSGTFIADNLPEHFLHSGVPGKSRDAGKSRSEKLSRYSDEINKSKYLLHKVDEKVIPFKPGIPAIKEFPLSIWSKLAAKSINELRYPNMSYGNPSGLTELRESIASYLRQSRSVNCESDQVIIVNGSQQALDLASRVLLNEDDTVLLEDPAYKSAKEVFGTRMKKIIHVPVREEGIDIDTIIKRKLTARLVYVTPSHQYPLGVTMPLSRRLQLLEWARKNSTWILEDDYDSEFRYAGRPLSSLQGLDENNRVIYVGTFSKVLFPAVRIAYMVVPPGLIDVFVSAKALTDRASPILEQLVLNRFIEEGHFGRHIRKMRLLYEERQEILIEAINYHLTDFIAVNKSDTGLHAAAMIDKKYNDNLIAEAAAVSGITINSLSSYCNKRTDLNGMVLGYAAFNNADISSAILKLAAVFKNMRSVS